MNGGIRSIIDSLRGHDGGIFLCPSCGGGKRNRRTLSIHLRDGVWLWLCHRPKCAEKGALAAGGEIRARPNATFEPKVLDWELRLPTEEDPIGRKLAGKITRPVRDFALWHGLRVSEYTPSSYAWIIRDLQGRPFGHVTRDASKQVLTWRERDAMVYAAFEAPANLMNEPIMVIVEDCVSAALAAEEGIRSIAVLSDCMTQVVAQEVAAFVRKTDIRVFVCPDPDNAGIIGAARTAKRLEAAGVERVGTWMLPFDVKDLTLSERRDTIRGMKDYKWPS